MKHTLWFLSASNDNFTSIPTSISKGHWQQLINFNKGCGQPVVN